MVTLKVPFRIGPLLREKEVDFIFKIATLEYATEEILGCDIWEVESQDQYDVSVAILFAAYIMACRVKYKKPRYGLGHASVWIDHMSKLSQEYYLKSVKELFGKMTGEGVKKK